MSDRIDLQFRPKTCFEPRRLEQHLWSKVQGAVLRKRITALLEAGRHEEEQQLAGDDAFSVASRNPDPGVPLR